MIFKICKKLKNKSTVGLLSHNQLFIKNNK